MTVTDSNHVTTKCSSSCPRQKRLVLWLSCFMARTGWGRQSPASQNWLSPCRSCLRSGSICTTHARRQQSSIAFSRHGDKQKLPPSSDAFRQSQTKASSAHQIHRKGYASSQTVLPSTDSCIDRSGCTRVSQQYTSTAGLGIQPGLIYVGGFQRRISQVVNSGTRKLRGDRKGDPSGSHHGAMWRVVSDQRPQDDTV